MAAPTSLAFVEAFHERRERSLSEQESSAADEPPRPTSLRRSVRVASVSVEVSDERGGSRDVLPLDLLHWGRTAGRVAVAEGVEREAELGLSFLDEEDMSFLAGRCMGDPGSTDVLAFPLDFAENSPLEDQGGQAGQGGQSAAEKGLSASRWTLPPALIGDVVVCPEVAARGAASGSRSLTGELTMLVIHGVLHLLGYDHAEYEEAALMEARTESLLKELNPQ